MLKKGKRVVCLLVIAVLTFTSSSLAFANESTEDSGNPSVTVNMDYTINSDQQTRSTGKTYPGEGGYSRLDYMSTGKYIKWEVHPKTLFSYIFVGTLKIYKSNKLVKTFKLYESGFGSEGDICDVGSLPKGSYVAKLRGEALPDVGFEVFTVSSLANLPFFKN